VKLRIGPMLGFKRFKTAAITIAGIELLLRIRKGQFDLSRLRLRDQRAPAVWDAVVAANKATTSRVLSHSFWLSVLFAPEPLRRPLFAWQLPAPTGSGLSEVAHCAGRGRA
jgi:hypothetical protein